MKFLSHSKNTDKIIAIFDIGSGSVGGAIVSISNRKIPTIITSVRDDIKFRKDFSFSDFVNDMAISLDNVSKALISSKSGAPSEIFCILSSPWYSSENRILTIEKNKDFIFNKKIADKSITEEIFRVSTLYKENYNNDHNIIEQYILSTRLDGIYNHQPINKRCKKAELNMIISLASSLCLDKIKNVTSKHFHHTKISFSSFTLMTHLAIRDKYIKDNSYLLVDIAGEVTDIGVVIDNILKSNISFPVGKKTFLKNICNKLGIESRDANEVFNLFLDNNLSKSLSSKISPIIEESENIWIKSFNQSVNLLNSKYNMIPNTVYLTTDNNVKNLFASIISRIKHPNTENKNYKYIVQQLDSFEFAQMCNFVSGVRDPFIMIEAIAISAKLHQYA